MLCNPELIHRLPGAVKYPIGKGIETFPLPAQRSQFIAYRELISDVVQDLKKMKFRAEEQEIPFIDYGSLELFYADKAFGWYVNRSMVIILIDDLHQAFIISL